MFEQWIFPIYETDERESISGQCFLVGDYLFTAAHVIEQTKRPHVKMERDIFLNKEDAIAYSYTPIINRLEDYEDYAIFHLSNELQSLFQLSEIGKECKLSCNYHRKELQENVIINQKYIFSSIEKSLTYTNSKICFLTSSATFDCVISPKLFQCKVSPKLDNGDSGCPIFTTDNQVIGFLIGARKENPDIHIFQNATYIKKIIEQCLEN